MRFPTLCLAALSVLGLACRSPLADLHPPREGPALALSVRLEDHSRRLNRLWTPGSEADTPEARRAALERHRQAFEADLRQEAMTRGLRLDPSADLRLDLCITSLGEVRGKYIAWGIASGVAWGVGAGLLAHDTRLAVGLGAYELLEESAFWIGGSLLMGRWSSPAVVEARLFQGDAKKPTWDETYYALWARRELAAFPPAEQTRRERQLRASLRKVLHELFHDLEAMPGFPRSPAAPLSSAPPAAAPAPAPPPPG
jgi:hypothetical protein